MSCTTVTGRLQPGPSDFLFHIFANSKDRMSLNQLVPFFSLALKKSNDVS
jgi:hypothetical protein